MQNIYLPDCSKCNTGWPVLVSGIALRHVGIVVTGTRPVEATPWALIAGILHRLILISSDSFAGFSLMEVLPQ